MFSAAETCLASCFLSLLEDKGPLPGMLVGVGEMGSHWMQGHDTALRECHAGLSLLF
jgi:hypothetical protein